MEDNTNVIEIERILKIAWEKKFYIILILLIFFVMGYYYSFYCVEPLYKSSSTILLVKSQEDEQNAVTQSDITLNQKLVSTYGEIMTSPKVVGKVISNLNLTIGEKELAKSISVTSVNSTEILKVSVSNKNATLAKNITVELINVFKEEVKDIYNINNVNVIGEAQIEKAPYNINHVRDIGIFIVLGIVTNCGMILVIYLLDTTIKTEEDIEKYVGLNVLTSIPIANPKLTANSEDNELIAQTDPKSPISEVFRTLRTNIAFTQAGKNIKNILVTSSNPGEGKSWTSSNLAIIFAQANKKTLLIDADMRKGRQHYIFEARNRVGLSNFLAAPDSEENIGELSNYIQTTKIPNLHLMTGGNRPPNPSELLSSDGKMKKLLDMLDLIYDVVIIDGTPSDIVSDSIIISNIVDSVIIVTASKQTKIKSTQKLKRLLETSKAKIGGVVLNKVQVSAKAYKNKYYYSDSGNGLKPRVEEKKQEIETVEQLIERLNVTKTKNDVLINSNSEEKELIESNFVNSNYNIEDSGEFRLQINNIGAEINNIKQIFMKVLTDNQNQIKETAISQNEIQLLKDKIDDLKTICTSLNLIRSDDVSNKVKEEIERLETIYNASQTEDADYVKSIEAKLENMKDLYYKSLEFENSVSTRTMEKIEDVKDVISSLKESLNEKIAILGKNDDLIELKSNVLNLENSYNKKLEDKFDRLEQVIIENSKVRKIEEIKEYIQEMQVEYTRELEKKFLNLEDTIVENYNSSEIADRINELKNEYYSKLQSECIEIQNCIKNNNNAEKLEELLREVQNTCSIELSEKINEMKDFYSSELTDKMQNIEIKDIDFSKLDGKFDEIKFHYSTELKDKLQNIYNLYSSDLDDSVDRIKEFENGKFEELKEMNQNGIEDLKNFHKENIDDVKDRLDEMQDRYSIELTAKIDDIQEHYTNKMEQLTEFNEDKFNDVKDKLDEMQDRYSIELNAKMEDMQDRYSTELNNKMEDMQDKYSIELNAKMDNMQENYSIKIDQMSELNQEQLNELRDELLKIHEKCNELNTVIIDNNKEQEINELKEKMENLQQVYSENVEKRIIDLQKLQNQNSKSVEIDEVKEEMKKLQEMYNDNIKAEFTQIQDKIEKQDIESAVANQLSGMKSEFSKIQRKLDEKDSSLEDEIYNMKQELIKIRKELDNKASDYNYSKKEQDNNVYRYNDYNEFETKRGFFGRRSDEDENRKNKKPLNAASTSGSDSSISQILKF